MNNPDMLIAVLTLAGAAVLLVTNWIRGDLVAVLVMLTFSFLVWLEWHERQTVLRRGRKRRAFSPSA